MRKADCQGCLISLTSTSTQEKVLDDVPIVREYGDMFLDYPSGTLLDRQVQFTIDLVPRATLASKAPYRMAQKELQELKMQLEELLDKGFITLSGSPRGALKLFVKKKSGTISYTSIIVNQII